MSSATADPPWAAAAASISRRIALACTFCGRPPAVGGRGWLIRPTWLPNRQLELLLLCQDCQIGEVKQGRYGVISGRRINKFWHAWPARI